MKKEWNFVGLLLAVLVTMMVLPVKEAVGQQGFVDVIDDGGTIVIPDDDVTPEGQQGFVDVIDDGGTVVIPPGDVTPTIAYIAIFDNGTLTFKYDENQPNGNYNSWSSFVSEIKGVVFDKSCMEYRPTNCANWFRGFDNLVEFSGLAYLNTENVTDMRYMFYGCSSLTELDLGNFNTSNVTNMDGMFDYCSNIQTIFVGDNWITANVTNYDAKLFVECKKLIGGNGTACIDDECQWSANIECLGADIPIPYARIDGGASNPGYFTRKPNEAYATFDTQNGTLTFYYDCNKPDGAFGMKTDEEDEWYSLRREITKVVFDQSFANYRPTSCAYWFNRCYTLSEIKGIENFNTANVESMENMFAYCTNLSTLDLSSLNTGSVENMSNMFYYCSGLSNLNLTGFNTRNVKDMSKMFSRCGSLTSLDLSSFDTRNVTDMSRMFYGNNKLAQINLSSFNTAKVIDMSAMFGGYNGGEDCDCRYTEDGVYGCNGDVDGRSDDDDFDIDPECGCYALKYLDLSSFNTGNVTNMARMFCYSGLKAIDLSSFNTKNVTDMGAMFYNCGSLTNLDLRSFDTKNVNNMKYMFRRCGGLTSLDLNSFNTSNVTNMYGMFEDCFNLASLNVRSFDTKNVTDMGVMFAASGVSNLDLSSFNTANVTNMCNMFIYCYKLKSLDLSSFKTDNVTNMDGMFGHCESLATIYVSDNWNNQSVNVSENMFGSCLKLVGSKGTVFYSGKTDVSYAHIDGGASSPGYFTKYGESAYVPTSPYATFTNGTLTLGYGSDIPNDATKISGEVIQSLSKSTSSNYIASDITAAKNVQKVVFAKTFADYQPENCAYWFNGCNNLTGIDGMENLDTKNTTDMTAMFQNCEKLASLDLSGFNTTKVTDMSKMFSNCTELATIFVGDTWNMSNVEKSQDMFLNCQKLVGGNGTQYDANNSDEGFAKIDGKNSGYFTKAGQEPYKVAEPYAVFDNGTLTFYYDGKKPKDAFEMKTSTNDGWTSIASEITKVVFDNSFTDYRPTSCEYWFLYCSNLTKIEGMKNLNTEDVTSIRSMFNKCEKLESIDLSGFNTQNVTNMRCAFLGCNNLKTLDLSKFKTDKVTTMYSMFKYCENLTNLDLSSFNTKNVTDMSYMLDSCVNLKTVDLSSFNTQNVTDISAMFMYCHSLSNVNLQGFNTANVEYMNHLFYHCNNLACLDLSKFNTGRVTTMKSIFCYCNNLKTLDLSSFNTKNVTDMSFMLDSCVNLTTVDLGSFNTKNVTNMCGMFEYCNNLATVDLSNFDTKNVTNMGFMFDNCKKLKNIDLSSFDTRNVTSMRAMFQHCDNVKNLDLEGFDTKNVEDMAGMFSSCKNLVNINCSGFDTKFVTNMLNMFAECNSLAIIDLGSFNTERVESMVNMFYTCTNLTTIYVGDNWSTSSVSASKEMFSKCTSLVGGKGTVFNSDKTDKTYARIDGGKAAPGYFTKSGEKPYEEPTPVSEITPAKDNIDIWSFDKTIYVQNPGKEIRIADMSGRLVKTVKATADRMEIPMQKSGIYIVKTGAKTQKVMIK